MLLRNDLANLSFSANLFSIYDNWVRQISFAPVGNEAKHQCLSLLVAASLSPFAVGDYKCVEQQYSLQSEEYFSTAALLIVNIETANSSCSLTTDRS